MIICFGRTDNEPNSAIGIFPSARHQCSGRVVQNGTHIDFNVLM